MKQIKQAFTLVELIVVVVILGILSTIAFMSFGSYPRQARDAVRITDLRNIEDALEFYKIKNGDYPQPSGATGTTNIEGVEGNWYVGTFGEDIISKIPSVTTLPTDPSDINKTYAYALSDNFKNYRIITTLEETGEEYIVANQIKTGEGVVSADNGNTSVNNPYPTATTVALVDGSCPIHYELQGDQCQLLCPTNIADFVSISQNPNTVAEFCLETKKPLGNETEYYIQLNTGLKWQKNSNSPEKWAVCTVGAQQDNGCYNFPEPKYVGNKYIYIQNVFDSLGVQYLAENNLITEEAGNGLSGTFESFMSLEDTALIGDIYHKKIELNGQIFNVPIFKKVSGVHYPAFQYCENIGEGWRMPNRNELELIYNENSLNTSNFNTKLEAIKSLDSDVLTGELFLSSTESENESNHPFAMTYHSDEDKDQYHATNKGWPFNFICVHD